MVSFWGASTAQICKREDMLCVIYHFKGEGLEVKRSMHCLSIISVVSLRGLAFWLWMRSKLGAAMQIQSSLWLGKPQRVNIKPPQEQCDYKTDDWILPINCNSCKSSKQFLYNTRALVQQNNQLAKKDSWVAISLWWSTKVIQLFMLHFIYHIGVMWKWLHYRRKKLLQNPKSMKRNENQKGCLVSVR